MCDEDKLRENIMNDKMNRVGIPKVTQTIPDLPKPGMGPEMYYAIFGYVW